MIIVVDRLHVFYVIAISYPPLMTMLVLLHNIRVSNQPR